MFLGHYGVGFAAKRVAPSTSLGTLLLAAQLVDLVWPIMVLAGAEVVRLDPGNTEVTPLDFVAYPWTHSLAAALGWGLLLGLGYLAFRGSMRAAAVRQIVSAI